VLASDTLDALLGSYAKVGSEVCTMKLSCLLVLASLIGVAGCGVGPNPSCLPKSYLNINVLAATLDHAAAPPGNQEQLIVTEGETFYSPNGMICATPTSLAIVYPIWTNPQPQAISISSANNSTNGLAVCTAATNGPVTLTGTVQGLGQGAGDIPVATLTITTQLTCK
jgi:hypothetical protein